MIHKEKNVNGKRILNWLYLQKWWKKKSFYFSWVQLKGVFRSALFLTWYYKFTLDFVIFFCCCLLYSLNRCEWMEVLKRWIFLVHLRTSGRICSIFHTLDQAPLAPAVWSQAHLSQGSSSLSISQVTCMVLSGWLGWLGWVVCEGFLRGRRYCRVF